MKANHPVFGVQVTLKNLTLTGCRRKSASGASSVYRKIRIFFIFSLFLFLYLSLVSVWHVQLMYYIDVQNAIRFTVSGA